MFTHRFVEGLRILPGGQSPVGMMRLRLVDIFSGMRRVIVTPAGRKRYLEVLYKHLKNQRDSFDEWLLLVNTSDPADIGYCERLAARNEDWIDTRYAQGSDPSKHNLNIHMFLNEFCREPDAVYLRLDDDVCWLAAGFVEEMFQFRLANPEPFLTYGNIINNAIVSWIHQKLGNISFERHSKYNCTDDIGWKDPRFAEHVHTEFLKSPSDPKWLFGTWVATEYERISVNAVCWFGKDLADKAVDADEELWLSVIRPRELSRPNAINGQAVCVHFAFGTQRDYLEKETKVLDQYRSLATSLK